MQPEMFKDIRFKDIRMPDIRLSRMAKPLERFILSAPGSNSAENFFGKTNRHFKQFMDGACYGGTFRLLGSGNERSLFDSIMSPPGERNDAEETLSEAELLAEMGYKPPVKGPSLQEELAECEKLRDQRDKDFAKFTVILNRPDAPPELRAKAEVGMAAYEKKHCTQPNEYENFRSGIKAPDHWTTHIVTGPVYGLAKTGNFIWTGGGLWGK